MAIIDLLTLMASLWLVASVTGMVALGALYLTERSRRARPAPGVTGPPPSPYAAPVGGQRTDGRLRGPAVRP